MTADAQLTQEGLVCSPSAPTTPNQLLEGRAGGATDAESGIYHKVNGYGKASIMFVTRPIENT